MHDRIEQRTITEEPDMTDASGIAERKPQDQPHLRVRASDAERERVAERLRAAVTEGRLTLAECDERLVELYAMKYRDEMAPLTADLPGGLPSGGFPSGGFPSGGFPSGGFPSGGWSRGPGGRPWRLVPWPFHALRVVAVLALIGVAVSAAGGHFFWPVIPLFFAVSMLARVLMFLTRRRRWSR